jgi:hypothetical protein
VAKKIGSDYAGVMRKCKACKGMTSATRKRGVAKSTLFRRR